MSQHLFLFTISPVQSFIAQARKTQDLFAGSKLLSELTKVAIEKVGQDNIIFPYVKGKNLKKEIDSLPNRFIAEIDNENDLAQFGKDVEDAVKVEFKRIAEDIFTKTLSLDKESTHKKLWEKFEKQITQHLDIHWLFLPFTDATYAEKFKEIEQLLGAIKNVRTFEQNEETGRKCSIDGERNALFFKHNYSKDEQGKETKRKPNYLDNDAKPVSKDDFRLEQGEGLSAVSMVKRLYEKEKFPATAEVALMADEVKAIEDEEVKKCLNSYKKIFQDEKDFILECLKIKENIKFTDKKDFRKPFDYQLLFEESINDKNIPNSEQLNCAKMIFPTLQKYFKTKYYALIAFDADSMGEWLSGSKINGDLKEFHQKLSEKLLEFGSWAKGYLDAPKGKAVYAGGDDFLGFVNLKHLFSVMKELRSQFKIKVNDEIKSFFKNDTDEITFSAGVVIAHYKTPLGEVLSWAKRMEDEAKELDKNKKDSFAIAVLKKSGEVIQAKSKWKDAQGNYLIDNIEHLYKELEKGKDESKKEGFSPTFIKSLNQELDIFSKDLRDKRSIPLADIIHTEMKRLTERACNIPNSRRQEKNDALKNLNESLKILFENSKYAESKVDNFLQILNLSDFLTRKITQD